MVSKPEKIRVGLFGVKMSAWTDLSASVVTLFYFYFYGKSCLAQIKTHNKITPTKHFFFADMPWLPHWWPWHYVSRAITSICWSGCKCLSAWHVWFLDGSLICKLLHSLPGGAFSCLTCLLLVAFLACYWLPSSSEIGHLHSLLLVAFLACYWLPSLSEIGHLHSLLLIDFL